MREQMHQTILTLIQEGKEINILELSEMEGFLDIQQEKDIAYFAPKNQRLNYIRNTVRSVVKSAGMMIRNIKKNTYKAITTPLDYQEELMKKRRKRNKAEQEAIEFEALMLTMNIPVQIEMKMQEGEKNAQNTKQNSIVATPRTSAKSKKAANG